MLYSQFLTKSDQILMATYLVPISHTDAFAAYKNVDLVTVQVDSIWYFVGAIYYQV